jgi:uncharacterized SAM-binding protein YcdF (DUF218 family)
MRDLRKYASQTNTRLILGALLVLLVVGVGLIWAIYGIGAAITGLLCIGAGLLPVLIIIGVLWLMDYIVRKNRPE